MTAPMPDTAELSVTDGEKLVDTRIDTGESCATLATDAFNALGAGGSFLLVADHDPVGINYMLRAEHDGTNSWDVVEDGPQRWQVRVGKTA